VRRLAFLVVAALLVASCGSGEERSADPTDPSPPTSTATSPSPTTTGSPTPMPTPELSRVRLRLEPIATLEAPLGMAFRTGDDALYIAGKTGLVTAIRNGRVDSRPVLDLSGQVSSGGEQGLLGLAFSPNGDFLYVNYTDLDGDTRVVEYRMGRQRANAGSARELLFVDQPFSNHNGGNLVFGPDGMLYIGLGDGGSGGDPFDNGQSLATKLGKMLRVDPRPSGGNAFGVPRDNPFVGQEGADPAIWAYGLRNPWRYSFDRETGDLWIGDVGQGTLEEIDFQPGDSEGGENYGWNRLEGTQPYQGDAPRGAVPPVHEYPTREGCAVTGGYVYRGTAIRGLHGAYLFGDFCSGMVRAIVLRGRQVVQERDLPIRVSSLASFGEDQDGELYLLALSGEVYRLVPR
jgi:glucose/arabinose dehydrogenase